MREPVGDQTGYSARPGTGVTVVCVVPSSTTTELVPSSATTV
ncbi:MAG: hypothetical protein ACRDL2_17310 [Gaiellaceae bacterium]